MRVSTWNLYSDIFVIICNNNLLKAYVPLMFAVLSLQM